MLTALDDTADGAIGNAGQEMGGAFSKDGAIGKQFTQSGSIGGTVQENMGGGESMTDKSREVGRLWEC
jgi:hypothetical protein